MREGPATIALMALEAPGNASWRGLIRQPDSTARAPPAANSSRAGCPDCSHRSRNHALRCEDDIVEVASGAGSTVVSIGPQH